MKEGSEKVSWKTFEVRHVEGLNGTPYAALATRAWLALHDLGFTTDTLNVSWEQEALVAIEGDVPIGLLTFSHVKWMKDFSIAIAWTDPLHRRKGVYTTLAAALVKRARAADATTITGYIATGNAIARAAAHSLGRKEVAVVSVLHLEPREE